MKVYFKDLSQGWVNLTIDYQGNPILQDSVSYTPYDSFGDLVDTLHMMYLVKNTVEKKVIFNAEPYEYEFTFTKNDKNIDLEIIGYPDYRRSAKAEHIWSRSGSLEEICKPFWRSLRTFQG